MDVEGSGERHGQDGEHDKAPSQCSSERPLTRCRWSPGEAEDVTERCAPAGKGLKDVEADCEEEEKKDGGEERSDGAEGEVLRQTACGTAGDDVGGEEPKDGGEEESKLKSALGTS